MKQHVFAVVAAVGLLSAPAALAADAAPAGIANKGNFIVSAERMFGLSFNSRSEESEVTPGNKVKSTTSHTDISVLFPISGFRSPYMIPRIGMDFTVIDGLTIGGAIGFARGASTVKSELGGQSTERDGPSLTAFLISPRVGYILPLGDNMGLWLRGGITYFSLSSSSESTTGTPPTTTKNTSGESGVALSLDPVFLITPVPHFGFYGGVMADIGLTGKDKSERVSGGTTQSTETDMKYQNFGLNFGLVGWL